jgi:diguanylate cyclase
MNHDVMHVTWSSWNNALVLLSFVVASFGAFSALELANNMQNSRGGRRILWLMMASLALGMGIWSMHYVGMNAFKSPLDIRYDLLKTLLSVVLAIAASAVAFSFVATGRSSFLNLFLGGLIAGAGVAGMHYTGMASMLMPATISYNLPIFILSVVIAIVVSTVAIWIFLQIGKLSKRGQGGFLLLGLQIAAAIVMGIAVISMHYTGMAATVFTADDTLVIQGGLDGSTVQFIVVVSSFALFFITTVIAVFSRNLSNDPNTTLWQEGDVYGSTLK